MNAVLERGAPPSSGLRLLELGTLGYDEALRRQHRLVEERAAGAIPDSLLLLEHPHVVTRGRGFNGFTQGDTRHPVRDADRGGDITYHGPGQLVGYPIIHLKERGLTIGAHLRRIEEALIGALALLGVEGERLKGFTGVWTGGRKIASIGIGARAWVSYHGFALNVTTDLSQFKGLYPCGLEPAQMTSLEALLPRRPDAALVRRRVAESFNAVYTHA
ncbi:MAG: lipoyl(octanoyl) transferase LipB [Elusimicrobia bacterium]|nr:lipoyl(octanoyl) transferase LipB [Elusimicrobiota bacterium]